MHWRAGTVVREVRRWTGAAEYAVRLAPGRPVGPEPPGPPGQVAREPGTDPEEPVRALAYDSVVGELVPGERVLLNVSALRHRLGTGGLALVVALADRLPPDPPERPGHIVKARYTPLQQVVLAVDEQDSPHHDLLADADSLDGMPVVVADLHSALPAVLAGVRADRPRTRVAYVVLDGGALPLAFSRSAAGLVEAGWLAATITSGQAFGADHEAVSVPAALLAARHVVGADLAVVTQGPGNAGTGTRWGFSGVAAVEALHAAHVLGGAPVAALRVSEADARERHRGISHHSRTAYGRALLAPAAVPVPRLPDAGLDALVHRQAAEMAEHSVASLDPTVVCIEGLLDALRAVPVGLSTMGRGLDQDAAAFLTSAAAGRYAAGLLA